MRPFAASKAKSPLSEGTIAPGAPRPETCPRNVKRPVAPYFFPVRQARTGAISWLEVERRKSRERSCGATVSTPGVEMPHRAPSASVTPKLSGEREMAARTGVQVYGPYVNAFASTRTVPVTGRRQGRGGSFAASAFAAPVPRDAVRPEVHVDAQPFVGGADVARKGQALVHPGHIGGLDRDGASVRLQDDRVDRERASPPKRDDEIPPLERPEGRCAQGPIERDVGPDISPQQPAPHRPVQ